MANEALAPAQAPSSGASSEDEYQTFCAALSASTRGRAFLAEYARRNRGADTEVLLAALARLEVLMRLQRADTRGELRTLLAGIRKARPDIAASALPVRAAKLALLLDLLERKLTTLAVSETPPAPAADARLAVVPAPEEPELPIPSPTAAQTPALTLAHDRGPPPAPSSPPESAGAIIIPDVTWLDSPPRDAADIVDSGHRDTVVAPTMADKVASLATQPEEKHAAPEPKLQQPPRATPLPPPADPLEALMLLSEEERLALFT
jgi:hypothetical protein